MAIVLSLLYLSFTDRGAGWPIWLWWPLVVSIWAAVLLTVHSGLIYVYGAVRLLHNQ